jgi:hypothetical protein
MKKGIIVLLITVLVAGFAFADVTKFEGSASVDYVVGLDKDAEFGFVNKNGVDFEFSFEFASAATPEAQHETDFWAEIAAEAFAGYDEGDLTIGGKITKADIHVGKFTFGILNAGTAANYAAHYTLDDNGDPIADVIYGGSNVLPGFTVRYDHSEDLIITGGFGAQGLWTTNDDNDEYKFWGHAETEFKFGENDEIDVLVGGYGAAGKPIDQHIGMAGKASYAADKFSADVAADLGIKKDGNNLAFEVAANATYDFLTLNVYAANGSYFSYADDQPVKLDAKLSAKYTFDIDAEKGSKVDVTGFVEAKDALIKALELKAGATETLAIDKLAVALGETVTLKNLANEDLKVTTTLDLSAKVTYTADKFTAYAQVKPSFLFDDVDSNEVLTALGVECGISSTAIVENATLALTYKKADFAKAGDAVKAKGTITASATISF